MYLVSLIIQSLCLIGIEKLFQQSKFKSFQLCLMISRLILKELIFSLIQKEDTCIALTVDMIVLLF